MCCLQSKFEPVTYFPLLTKHRPRCSKIENCTKTHTTHLYFTDNFLCSFYLFSQSQQSLTKCIFFVCFERPKLSLSFFNCSCSPIDVKWSKRVSLRSVSFTNYPTLHHPLIFPPDDSYRKNTLWRMMCCLQSKFEPVTLTWGGISVRGVSGQRHSPDRDPPPCTVKIEWYVSYWNAFLFSL